MSCASTVLAVLCCFADADKPDTLVYLRDANGSFLKESEITTTTNADGRTIKSRTDQGKAGSTTLTLRYDTRNRLASAEVVQETPKAKKSATLTVPETKQDASLPAKQDVTLQIKRGGVTVILKATAEPVIGTAADCCDLFQLVHRYDGKVGKSQEFQGIWLHPVDEPKVLSLSIERVGNDTITIRDRPIVLDRFRIKVKSGDYLVWADPAGQVCRIVSLDRKAAVMLKGYEEATRDLAK